MPNIDSILRDHVTLQVESIDRIYLNGYLPGLQRSGQLVYFLTTHRKNPIPSPALLGQITRRFVEAIHAFAEREGIPIVEFKPGERKDDVAKARLARFRGKEGVVFIGVAQEADRTFRSVKKRGRGGRVDFDFYRGKVFVNHYYFYILDRDFGPGFIKFSSYAPFAVRVCLNGHEWAKCQLANRGIGFEALDNGFLSCAEPATLQHLCDELCAKDVEKFFRRWLARLPHPFTPQDRAAGYRYAVSILQAEFARTQVLDRPLSGRIFFEEVIRENLDLGRPDQVQLIFARRVTKRTPGRFRTRVITQGVTPALYVDYKNTRIKQYHKEGQALRTETTINDTRDFAIGKRLHNLPALRAVGFAANRRLQDVQRLSHDCQIGEDAFRQVTRPQVVQGQRVSALSFADPRVQALLSVLVLFCLLPQGFANKEVRERLALLLGLDPSTMTPGRMTYDLRRLRLHGLIARLPHRHRYRVTHEGLRTALFFTRVYARILRPGLARITPLAPPGDTALRPYFDKLEVAIDQWIDHAQLAA